MIFSCDLSMFLSIPVAGLNFLSRTRYSFGLWKPLLLLRYLSKSSQVAEWWTEVAMPQELLEFHPLKSSWDRL